ncbi:ABC transporter ATP-binding protein [Leeia sp.]|uniref:ABC transporter ATP-binding protein n=1 Tax=Leeia sp. TaxID=2884678 RepID=UPI0035B49AE9
MTDTTAILQATRLGRTVQVHDQALPLLQDIHLTVHAGETLAVVGRSGSGKSTLLALLAGLDQFDHGDVQLFGQSLAGLDEDGRARLRAGRVGFVFQNFQLLPTLSALENVRLPLELAGDREADARARDMLQQVGLAERIEHMPAQLSGGEQQRVALARAFVIRPQLLFADEPTGNLDAHTGEQISDLLFDLNQRFGTTLVLITHDEELARRCQRRLTLSGGRQLTETMESSTT